MSEEQDTYRSLTTKVRMLDSADEIVALVSEPLNDAEYIIMQIATGDARTATSWFAKADAYSQAREYTQASGARHVAEEMRERVRAYVYSILVFREHGHE